MKIIKNLFLGLLALIILMSTIGLLALPRVSVIERSLVMQAPAEVIYDQVNDLKKNVAWSPWKDPTMVITYGATTEGKGAMSSWVSEKMGNGTMTITETIPAQSIDIDLDFGAMGIAKSKWVFAAEGASVKVTETMTSDAGMNPAKRWMSLMSDKMVGPMFEKGLATLKEVSEARAAELKTEQATQQAAVAGPDEATTAPEAQKP
jgi:ribosome-associated toxin RatA of RatAB toxin-antitoxin module